MQRPERLIYLSSMMHTLGTTSLDDLDWTERPWHPAQAYGDSKLLLTTFAATMTALARRVQQRGRSRMGPDADGRNRCHRRLGLGHVTQCWLAVSDDSRRRHPASTGITRRPNPPPTGDRSHVPGRGARRTRSTHRSRVPLSHRPIVAKRSLSLVAKLRADLDQGTQSTPTLHRTRRSPHGRTQ